MANVPFPLTAGENDFEYMKSQVYELIRQVYEDKIGGADLGDVFAIVGDVLTLTLGSNSGLTKSGNELAVNTSSTGGLYLVSEELLIKILSTGGLETTASGLGIKLDGASLALSADGLSVASGHGIPDPGDTVVEETSFGQSSTAGVSTDYSRVDHSHGTPDDPYHFDLSWLIYSVETHDTDTVLVAADLLKLHIMDVSGGERNFTLPDVGADDVGNWIILVRNGTANALRVHAGGMDIILNSTAGGYIECDEARDFCSIKLIVVADGQWVAPEYGIWSSY